MLAERKLLAVGKCWHKQSAGVVLHMLTSNSFFWVSFDPESKKNIPYDSRSSRHLEAALRDKMTDVTLLLDVEEAVFIANVQLDLVGGEDVQRLANSTGCVWYGMHE